MPLAWWQLIIRKANYTCILRLNFTASQGQTGRNQLGIIRHKWLLNAFLRREGMGEDCADTPWIQKAWPGDFLSFEVHREGRGMPGPYCRSLSNLSPPSEVNCVQSLPNLNCIHVAEERGYSTFLWGNGSNLFCLFLMERVSSRISLWGLRGWVDDRQATRGRERNKAGRGIWTLSGDGDSKGIHF